MTDIELVQALRRMSVETGSLICLDCEHEHNCGIHGCAIMRTAAGQIEQLTAEPPNDPLTLEELRGMDGEPIRIVEIMTAQLVALQSENVEKDREIERLRERLEVDSQLKSGLSNANCPM